MVIWGIRVLCVVAASCIVLIYLRGSSRDEAASKHVRSWATRATLTFGMECNRMLHVMQWIAQYAPGVIRASALVEGRGRMNSDEPALLWLGKVTAAAGIGMQSSLTAAVITEDAALAGAGTAISLAIPFILWRDLEQKVRERHRAMVTELPVFIHKLSLLIGAGESVQGAWIRASVPPASGTNHPLYRELGRMRSELLQSVPFPNALELFAHRCGIPETNFLAAATSMNYRRGGEAFLLILQQTGRSMIEKKRTLLKTMGEEATTKLVFPMVLIFAAIMAVVAAPAIMLMNQGL